MAKKESTYRKSPHKGRKRKGRKKRKKIKVSIWIVIAALITLAALISLPYLKHRQPDGIGARIPAGAYSYGIDISHYQERIEWDSLMVMTDAKGKTINSMTHAKDLKPVSYVFIKATEGNNLKDKKFKKHWKEAGEKGIRRGAYHFFRSSKDPEAQADHFIKTVGNLRYKDLPPVLDLETMHKGCTRKELNEKALRWLNKIEAHYGRKPIVYSGASFIENILCDEIKSSYPIWVAHYEADSPRCEKWHFWQFTDRAVVHGVEGHVDMSVCPTALLDKL